MAEEKETMITEEMVARVGYEVMKRAVSRIPEDIFEAIRAEQKRETRPDTQHVYKSFFEFVDRRTELGGNICPDTGTIMYYVSMGNGVSLHPGLDFWRALAGAAAKLTREGILSPKSGDPVRHINNNLNVGQNSPSLHYRVVPEVDFLEITAVAKGGGGEMAGSKFRMLSTADGLPGVKKFVVDGAVSSAKGGLNCPPAVYGVGIGGGLGIAGALAHEAAVLRPVGSRNPDPFIADLEVELLELINYSGVGPAGLGGQCTALDVHVECSNGHMMVVAAALVSQCLMAHRATGRIYPDGRIEEAAYPSVWFHRPWRQYGEEAAGWACLERNTD